MKITYAEEKDIAAIAAAEAACFPPAEAATEQEFVERIKYYGNHFWLLYEGDKLLAYVDGNAAKNQDSGDTYSRWYALNSGGTLIGPSTMFRKGDNGRIHYPGRSAAYCSSTLAGGKPLPMYDWKAGDATGEGTYYERKMTTAYGMRCVKE